ncbi:MAG: DNA translocase FtsK [Hyphomicrobiales bacterium]
MFEIMGLTLLVLTVCVALSLATWSVDDPSLNYAVAKDPRNLLGYPGAVIADLLMQMFGLGVIGLVVPMIAWSTRWLGHGEIGKPFKRALSCLLGAAALAGFMSVFTVPSSWPLPTGLGGVLGDMVAGPLLLLFHIFLGSGFAAVISGIVLLSVGTSLVLFGCGFTSNELVMSAQLFGEQVAEVASRVLGRFAHIALSVAGTVIRIVNLFKRTKAKRKRAAWAKPETAEPGESLGDRWRDLLASLFDPVEEAVAAPVVSRVEPHFGPGEAVGEMPDEPPLPANDDRDEDWDLPEPKLRITRSTKEIREATSGGRKVAAKGDAFALPPLALLAQAPARAVAKQVSDATLAENARILEGVLEDFGVRGDIINVRPGPVVTLYELEPAPGIKSSRVIGLADDIARSMSAVSARVAVVPGRNVIGIELPNAHRETVYLRELLASEDFAETRSDLTLALGKDIGGQPILSDLARMPHLLIAGTTGSGKSVGINTMILSLLFRLPPDRCKLILIDPKMLELSVYDGIPHLLAPVVTEPKKAVVALKWTVREMEDRYRKMSKIGVRNVHGYNQRISQALEKGEVLTRSVHTGYDPNSGEPIYEDEEMDLEMMPFIVVIIDEMADLMMVAGKDIEGAVQRLAQMARAAGIHMVTATQRPSVDVITGTIKANFPTRISFQVTSKIDSRTILGEQGAEQLLGQGDMLYMAGGGRISRIHAPFVSDEEVEKIVKYLKKQGAPEYLEAVTEESDDGGEMMPGADGMASSGNELYDQAVAIVIRDKKASTSYIQRRLSIGYNRAASLIEKMEQEGVISPANHAGKREILVGGDDP